MPILLNPRQERFCQELASGKSANEAYTLAGYNQSRFNASRLKTKDNIAARIAEIVAETSAKSEITMERAIREFGRIGFADVRQVVAWHTVVTPAATTLAVIGDTGEVATPASVIPETVTTELRLIDSDKITDETAAAIAEVYQTDRGALRVKMHNKIAALEAIVRQLERGKGADLSVAAEQPGSEVPIVGPGIVDAREAFRRYGPGRNGGTTQS